MAQTLEQLRNQIKTQVYGRRLGLDNYRMSPQPEEYLVGAADMRKLVELITTTAGSSLASHGYSQLSTTTASSAINTLQAPVPGVDKVIVQTNTSTLGHQIQLAAGTNVGTSTGSSANQITFLAQGASVRLTALSSVLWWLTAGWPGASGSSNYFFTSTF